MSQIETIIRYDGPALAEHDMDVEELAPALLALAGLIQAANHKFNGDRSAVRVTVNADIEQKCFQMKIKFVQDLLEKAKSFLDGDVATLKDILDWLGIIGGSTFSLFSILIALGKKERDSTKFTATAGDDSTIYQVENLQQKIEQHVHLHFPEGAPEEVKQLLSDPVIVGKALDVMRPAALPDYTEVAFFRPGAAAPEFRASKAEVEGALELAPSAFAPGNEEVADPDDETPVPFKTRVFVKTQRNEGVGQWELKWGGRAKLVSIDDTDWLTRFQKGEAPHPLPLYLDVQMEMITSNTNPDAPERYRVVKVLDVVQSSPSKQSEMFDGDEPA